MLTRWLRRSGPLFTLVVIVAIESLIEDRLPVPNLAIVLLAPIVYSVLAGGTRWGLISGSLALVYYAYHVSPKGTPFHGYDAVDIENMVTTALVAPFVVLSLGFLKSKLDDLLVRERQLREEAEARLRQQAAVARLGALALGTIDPEALLGAAVRAVCEGLDVEHATALELAGDELVLRAGIGWRAGLVGHATIRVSSESQTGYTLTTNQPVVVNDLASETAFGGSPLLVDHGINSGITVVVRGLERPWGVIGAHTTATRRFSRSDANFLESVANVIAEVIERKRVEDELTESEAKFRQMAENLDSVLFLSDLDESKILYVNPAYERVWGCSIESLYRRLESWLDAVHAEDRARAEAAAETMRSTGYLDEVFRIVRPDGSVRWIHDRVFPVHATPEGGVQRVVGIAEDVTEQRSAEENARHLLAEQAARAAAEAGIRARDDVLAFVSHDLRSPLNTIALGAEMLEESIDDPDLAQGVDAIRWATRRMNRLIDDLLSASKIQAGRFSIAAELADPLEIVHAVINAARSEARRCRITVEIDAPEELPLVHADDDRIVQALSNLTGNAIKFTPAGGRVVVRARARGTEVLFAVADDGPGIPAEDQARLFDRFWQGRSSDHRGAGLGLAITKAIVEAHGGSIWVESEPDRGSTFYFTLPCESAAARRGQSRDEHA